VDRVPRRRSPDATQRQSDRQAGAREAPELRRRPHRSARVKTPTPPDERLEEAVYEAVFQYQLQQPLADAPHPLRYYVARQGLDPSEAVLGRLRRRTPRVQPFSQCQVSGRDGVVDRTTGARGVILQVPASPGRMRRRRRWSVGTISRIGSRQFPLPTSSTTPAGGRSRRPTSSGGCDHCSRVPRDASSSAAPMAPYGSLQQPSRPMRAMDIWHTSGAGVGLNGF